MNWSASSPRLDTGWSNELDSGCDTISREIILMPSVSIGIDPQMQASAGVSWIPPRLVKKMSFACAEIEPTVLAP